MRACEDDADNRDDNPDLVKKITSRGRMEYQPTKMARRKIGSRTAAAAAACLLILFIHSGTILAVSPACKVNGFDFNLKATFSEQNSCWDHR